MVLQFPRIDSGRPVAPVTAPQLTADEQELAAAVRQLLELRRRYPIAYRVVEAEVSRSDAEKGGA